ncbi:MAG: DNA mismatch repair endonuclease MutL [Planctomycetota bacterium]|jgi:DNA mismatch repair protein MutL
MGQIKLLDQNMINMIAAGEVIERPASVVKELMENSIDAQAAIITVSIEDGGKKLISVSDNGCGMDAEDLAKAFEPHATSKISSASELDKIATLGFRGEALASIGSIAHVEAVSKTGNAVNGSRIEIDCGSKSQLVPCSADYGTTIQIRDLFYKLPARRKFLKTTNTELTHISEVFRRISLPNSNLNMTLIHNGKELYQLSNKYDIRQRIARLFSSEISDNLIETESDEKGMHISALLGRPDISRTNSKLQYIFLNGRFIKDRFISHAIKEAYHGLIEPARFGVVFLFIEMPCKDFDVNVHPTKIEVRFYNANLVHSQILGCLRERFLSTNLDINAKFSISKSVKDEPIASERDKKITDAVAEFFKKHRPNQPQQQFGFRPSANAAATHKNVRQFSETTKSYIPLPPQKNFLQIHDSFIATETDDGFIIIDQHALHERILYEKLREQIINSNLESQKLLVPESFEVTDEQENLLKQHYEILEKLGIELVAFGPKTMAVQSFPTILTKASPVDFVHDLIDLLADKNLATERLLDEVLNMAACKAAIKAGQPLKDSEIEQLLKDRETIENPSRCPHGRPSAIKFSIAELEKQFKRT